MLTSDEQVTILAPTFAVSAYNEIWEYDDPATPNSPSKTISASPGVHERRRNHTSVILQVVPKKVARERDEKEKQNRDARRVEVILLFDFLIDYFAVLILAFSFRCW